MNGIIGLSEAISIGLHAVGVLAQKPGEAMSAKEIARRIGASEAHLSKVLQRLVKAGLLQSQRGPKGGFFCDSRAVEKSLLEIYEAIEGPLRQKKCLLKKPVCDGDDCVFGGLIDECNSKTKDYFSLTRVGDICKIFKEA